MLIIQSKYTKLLCLTQVCSCPSDIRRAVRNVCFHQLCDSWLTFCLLLWEKNHYYYACNTLPIWKLFVETTQMFLWLSLPPSVQCRLHYDLEYRMLAEPHLWRQISERCLMSWSSYVDFALRQLNFNHVSKFHTNCVPFWLLNRTWFQERHIAVIRRSRIKFHSSFFS